MEKPFLVKHVERPTGIGPAYEAWEASVLPLNYGRIQKVPIKAPLFCFILEQLLSAQQMLLLILYM